MIQALLRMVYHSSGDDLLREVINVPALSSQVAGMLSSGDLKIIVGALQLSEILLQKMPEEFGVHFRREGVLYQVQKLTDPDNPISVNQYSESPLSATASPAMGSWSLGTPRAPQDTPTGDFIQHSNGTFTTCTPFTGKKILYH